MKKIEYGERVCSNVSGFYQGLPGTLRGLSQAQYGNSPMCKIELDIGKSNS